VVGRNATELHDDLHRPNRLEEAALRRDDAIDRDGDVDLEVVDVGDGVGSGVDEPALLLEQIPRRLVQVEVDAQRLPREVQLPVGDLRLDQLVDHRKLGLALSHAELGRGDGDRTRCRHHEGSAA
jgi:hypothetical protein